MLNVTATSAPTLHSLNGYMDDLTRNITTPASGNRTAELVAVVVSLLITSLLTGALRFYTHKVLLGRLFAEDYLALAALVRCTTSRAWDKQVECKGTDDRGRLFSASTPPLVSFPSPTAWAGTTPT
ncbi:hypothetical protein NLG97_g8540 [Lecanicillium saksenae]|uniref:Uncharacterized protein n=1 Tax=Lecanicillium saksenae TaxID=468837 RepID=A0ACC1QIR8_9HYPO|nr:hypothetical protein NLG97_g8540 [Lecanicillium saksenae]